MVAKPVSPGHWDCPAQARGQSQLHYTPGIKVNPSSSVVKVWGHLSSMQGPALPGGSGPASQLSVDSEGWGQFVRPSDFIMHSFYDPLR